jgi:hypothetical protein
MHDVKLAASSTKYQLQLQLTINILINFVPLILLGSMHWVKPNTKGLQLHPLWSSSCGGMRLLIT